MSNKEMPILLLTGYLGSGKTTLVNRILKNEKGIRFAVIVNDIGEVNIDATLIQQGGMVGKKDDSLVALQNGCICCTLKTDLMQQIVEIMKMDKFDYIVTKKWPKSVIRAKGMCYFRDEPDTCYLFEQSGKQFNITNAGQWFASMPAEELEQFMEQNPNAKNDWDENYGDRMQKLVFIGQNMDRKALKHLLDACLAV